jgi:UDP-N-acetylmuramoyl-tripeptide--D-alanyl-D-alanine ligase
MLENKVKFSSNELIAIFGSENCIFIEKEFITNSVSTDTRSLEPDSIFVALIGENHDGHANVSEAFSKGALICIVNKNWFSKNSSAYPDHQFVVVENSLNALGRLANFHRHRFDLDIIAVAGSNGKTTTKEMIAGVLETEYNTLKTYKNYNNQIGVPLMLFQLDGTQEKAILEIGTNEPGEIILLSEMVSPSSGIITNIGKEHLEGFLDLDGVEMEETSLFAFLKKSEAPAFVNMNDERLVNYAMILDNKYTYGISEEINFSLNAKVYFDPEFNSYIEFFGNDFSFGVKLQAKGLNFVYNAIAAAAVGMYYKVSVDNIKKGLESFSTETNSDYARMAIESKNGITLLNDTYNANPSSTQLALDTLGKIPGVQKRIAILGDMRELGETSVEEHTEILKEAVKIADKVFLLGDEYQKASEIVHLGNFCHFEKKELLFEFLKEEITDKTAILVKGSRGMKMEEISVMIRSELLL